MGYLFKELHDAWERYLPQLTAGHGPETSEQGEPGIPLPPAGIGAHTETGIRAVGAD
jgi:hypothetical protein